MTRSGRKHGKAKSRAEQPPPAENAPPADDGGRSLRGRILTIVVWTLFLSALALKLFLIRHDEVRVVGGIHDDLWFMLKADSGYYDGAYSHMAYIKEPLYPLFVLLTHGLGVPLRLATELVFMGSALLLVTALRRVGISRISAAVVFAILVFHPYCWDVFLRAVPDALFLALVLALVAFQTYTVVAVRQGRLGWWPWIGAGLAAGLLCATRPESIYVWGVMFLHLCALWLTWRLTQGKGVFPRDRGLLIRAALPAAGLLAVTMGFKLTNYIRAGFWGMSQRDTVSFQGAIKALMSADGDDPAAYCPVRLSTLERAARVCPAVEEIYPLLAGDLGKRWASYASGGYKPPPGEIGGGHFQWALRDAVARRGHSASAEMESRFYGAIASEVSQAQSEGLLPDTWVWSTSVGQTFSVFSGRFWGSGVKIAKRALYPRRLRTYDGDYVRDQKVPNKQIVALFDKMAGRRHVSAQTCGSRASYDFLVRGWAINKAGNSGLRAVWASNRRGELSSRIGGEVHPAPAVLRAFRLTPANQAALRVGFVLRAGGKPSETDVTFLDNAGTEYVIKADALVPRSRKGPVVARTSDGMSSMLVGVSHCENVDPASEQERLCRTPQAVRAVLAAVYGHAAWLMLLAWAVLLGVNAVRLKGLAGGAVPLILGGFLLAATSLRIFMLAAIDSSMYPGNSIRYLFPCSVMALSALALMLLVQVEWLIRR